MTADRPIGYYVHHHGDGHRQRALAFASINAPQIVLLGTGLSGRTGPVQAIDLPDDRTPAQTFDGLDEAPFRPLALHYAPIDLDGVRQRTALICDWIARKKPALMIVDVSVEVAMLARLCATRVAYVRLGGRRNDPAHFEAFRGASVLIAPFARALDDPNTPEWVSKKTIFCPGIVLPNAMNHDVERNRILIVAGRGGVPLDADLVADAARRMPSWNWRIIGHCRLSGDCPQNLSIGGWVEDPQAEIVRSAIVVGAAGDGLVNAVIAATRPFICIPEERPFGEQTQKAKALGALGAAVVCKTWPDASDWAGLLERALRLSPRALQDLGDPDGARRAYEALAAIARH